MAEKKSKGKQAKGSKGSANDAPSVNEILLKKALKMYETYSAQLNVKCCPDVIRQLKACLEDNVALNKILFRPIEISPKAEEQYKKALSVAQEKNDINAISLLRTNFNNANQSNVLLEPLMRALKEVQLSTCKELYIVDVPLFFSDIVQLTHFVKIASNQIKRIEMKDCLLDAESIQRFSTFGDKGCFELCRGLRGNEALLNLSLNYCQLTSDSGAYLGEILSTTALKNLFLDGNSLRCSGVLDLVSKIVEECENEAFRKEVEEKEKQQKKDHEPQLMSEVAQESSSTRKKKKKKKKKETDEPAKVGPFVCKLHLADNEIDIYEVGGDEMRSLKIVYDVVDAFVKLIKYSPDMEELDLNNNRISNMNAKMILNALEYRKLKKVGSLGVKICEKVDPDLFNQILKLSKNVKKKKGRK